MWEVLRADYSQALYYAGRGSEAQSIAEAAARQHRTPLTLAAVGLTRYQAGDVEGGVAALREAGGEMPLIRVFLAQGLAAQGKVEEALRSLAGSDDSLTDIARAQVLAYAGRLREGVADLDHAARRPGEDVQFNRQATSWYLAAAGDLDRARRTAEQGGLFTVLDGPMLASVADRRRLAELAREVGPETQFQGRFLRALTAWMNGDRMAALADLRALDRKGSATFVPYYRGLLAHEERLDEEAVECLRRFDGPILFGSDGYVAPWLLARARFLRARSLERLGRREEAQEIVDLQLQRWKDADPDLPLLAELKALRSRL
jgi:hypothetical protein